MRNLQKELILIMEQKTPYIKPLFQEIDGFLQDYYIAAGVVTQSVWNHLHGYHPSYGISDADVVFHDVGGTLEEEKQLEMQLNQKLVDLPFSIDVTNEALVHLWYEKKFNKNIPPYASVGEAICTWPTTASAIGVSYKGSGDYDIYAPFGLEDLFEMIIRPNKKLITEDVYWKKVDKWKARWPELTILPW